MPKGLLLYGPPGTGKTMIAKAIKSELCRCPECKGTNEKNAPRTCTKCNGKGGSSQWAFKSITSADINDKYVGESAKNVRKIFEECANSSGGTVLFMDEIDALLSARKEGQHANEGNVKTEFLTLMEGVDTKADRKLLIVGATNLPWAIDEAVLRRFPVKVMVGLPDAAGRRCIIKQHLDSMGKDAYELSSSDWKKLVNDTKKYSGSDLKSLVMTASKGPILRASAAKLAEAEKNPGTLPKVSLRDFVDALKDVRPTTSAATLLRLENWNKSTNLSRDVEVPVDDGWFSNLRWGQIGVAIACAVGVTLLMVLLFYCLLKSESPYPAGLPPPTGGPFHNHPLARFRRSRGRRRRHK